MIAVDTNILVYAHRLDSEFNSRAFEVLNDVSRGPRQWAIPWPCLHEFFAVVTHPRIYSPPSTPQQAIEQIDAWLESPFVTILGESDAYWPKLRQALTQGQIKGPMVHDARIAAICEVNGVFELLTADRDFSRFPKLTTRNPLI